MAFIDWTPDFSTGVDQMDYEHQGLMKIMNRLFDENSAAAPFETILATLDELGQATVDHFRNEEAFMDTEKYEKVEIHKRIHQDLLEKFGLHLTAYKSEGGQLSPDFFKFLSFWLSAHIRGIDKQYGPNNFDVMAA